MQFVLPILLAVAQVSPSAAAAPDGKSFGEWLVASVDGSAVKQDGETSVILVETSDAGVFSIEWTRGRKVIVTARIKDCYRDGDMDASYSLEPAYWLQYSKAEAYGRLRADFTGWIDQARIACRPGLKLNAFQIQNLDEATGEFLDRLKRFTAAG